MPILSNLGTETFDICCDLITNQQELSENLKREIYFVNSLTQHLDKEIYTNITQSYVKACGFSYKDIFID